MFVTIYGRLTCPYCVRAKTLAEQLKTKISDFDFRYIDMPTEGLSKEDLEPIIGKPVQTVPQILIDDQPIGGCTDFQAFVKSHFGEELE